MRAMCAGCVLLWAALALPCSALADITSGLNWLATQPNTDGSFGATAASVGGVFQSTAEVARAYQAASQTAQPSYAPALGYINGDTQSDARFLALQILVNQQAGNDVTAWVGALLLHQKANGDFADWTENDIGSVLVTAQALQALAAVSYSTGSVVPAALGFLLDRQQANGGWQDGANETSVFLTAHALRALTPYRSAYLGLPEAITKAQNYLLSQRTASALWSEPFESALALTALIPVADFALLTNSVDALQSAQLANGSWANDSYTTALALQALWLATHRLPSVGLSHLQGTVIDAITQLPLAGASVQLAGAVNRTTLSDAVGAFAFADIPPGSYTLTVSLNGYSTLTTVTTTQSGEVRNLGNLAITSQSNPTTGIIRGSVTDASTNQPLAGVSLTVSSGGSATSGADGSYQIANVPTGALTVIASRIGYASASGSATMVAGGTLIFSPSLFPTASGSITAIEGTVTDGNTNAPLSGATITVTGSTSASATTDAEGRYRIEPLNPGEITAVAALAGYQTVSATATVTENTILRFSPKLLPLKAGMAKFFIVSNQEEQSTNQIFRYHVASPADAPTLDLTLNHPSLDRPLGITFNESGEMFVINRGAPSAGNGSVSRFVDPRGAPTFNGAITASQFSGPHYAAFRFGELFIAQRFGNNVLRFSFDANGNAHFNGAITAGLGDTNPPPPRGVAMNPATGELFVTECCGVNEVNRYVFDASGNAMPNGVITGNGLSNPHDLAFSPWGELFVANADNNSVSRFVFDAAGNATANGQITGNAMDGPVGLDFSPWGELFVASYRGAGAVSRFTFGSVFEAIPNGSIATPVTVGDIQFAPDPNAPSIIGTVVDAGNDQPLARVSVVAQVGGVTRRFVTSADGRFKLTGLPAGQVSLQLTREGYVPGTWFVDYPAQVTLNLGQIRLRPEDVEVLLPDLVVQSVDSTEVTRSPHTLIVGGTLNATIANQGSAPTRTGFSFGTEFSVAAFVDVNGNRVYDVEQDIAVGGIEVIETLAAGTTQTLAIPLAGTLPYRDAPILVFVDSGTTWTVVESNETNNVFPDPPATASPDLTAGRLRFIAPTSGGAPSLSVIVGNAGAAPSPADVHVGFYEGDPAASGKLLGDVALGALAAGAYQSVELNNLSSLTGDIPLYALVDSTYGVTESREDNNLVSIPGPQIRPDLVVSGVDASGAITDPHTLLLGGSVTTVIANQGTLAAPSGTEVLAFYDTNDNQSFDTGIDIKLGSALTANDVGAGQSIAVEVSLQGEVPFRDVPVHVWVDSQQSVTEINETNNVGTSTSGCQITSPPVLTNIAPLYAVAYANQSWSAHTPPKFTPGGSGPDWNAGWWGSPSNPLWVVADLQSAFSVNEIVLKSIKHEPGNPFFGYTNVYNLYVGTDGTSWTKVGAGTLVQSTDPTKYMHTITLPESASTIRYVKYEVVGGSHWAHLIEMQIWSLQSPPPASAPDVTASLLRLMDQGTGQGIALSLRVGNGGAAPVAATQVAFYDGHPASGGTLLGTTTVTGISAGGYKDITFTTTALPSGANDIYALADSDNAIAECREDNNVTHVAPVANTLGTIGVSTDASVYNPNSPALLQGTVTNTGSLASAFSAELRVEDLNGVTVQSFPPQPVATLSGGASASVTNTWNTGTTLAGTYRLHGFLRDAQGGLIAEADSAFQIGHGDATAPVVSLRVTTDRPVYHTTDKVDLASLVRNLTSNTIVDGAKLVLSVTSPSGAIVYTNDGLLKQLLPSALLDLLNPFSFANTALGVYQVNGSVVDSAGQVLATDQTQYEVRLDLNKALQGQVTATLATLEAGQTQNCTSVLTNVGSLPIAALETHYAVVNLDTGALATEQVATLDLAASASNTYLHTFATAGFTAGNYACALQARISQELKTLAYAPFVVTVPPIKIDAELKTGTKGRLLILLDPAQSCGGTCLDDIDPHGPTSAPGLANQRLFLEALLKSHGWSYTLVENAEAFTFELRSGNYNLYALFNEQEKLSEQAQKELREAIFQGQGLLIAGAHDHRELHNNKLLDTLGLDATGNDPKASEIVFTESALNLTGKLALLTGDQLLRIEPLSAVSAARYTNPSNGNHTPEAVTLNAYGTGKAAFAAFDLIALATLEGDEGLAAKLLLNALTWASPTETPNLTGTVKAIDLTLTNQGIATTAIVTVTLPAGVTVLDANGGTLTDNTLVFTTPLAVEEVKTLTFWIKLPTTAGEITIEATVTAEQHPDPLAAPSLTLTVSTRDLASAKTMLDGLIAANHPNTKELKQARQALDRALAAGTTEQAIAEALKATDALLGITDPEIRGVRVAIDEWIWVVRQSL